jgi:transketolase
MDEQRIRDMTRRMRRSILEISHASNTSAHLGGCLSIVDILATLYGAVLTYDPKDPAWEGRDRFVLSKGHGALGYYCALHEAGVISEDVLRTFQTNGSALIAHPVMNIALGIESSNGSLGHGLSMGVGLALAAKKKRLGHRIYVLLGDGECNEGSVWESVMSAAQLKLDNLVAIVDHNHYQNDGKDEHIINFGDFAAKWCAFGWNATSVNGHDVAELYEALTRNHVEGKPTALIAQTIKGKGVPFMENNNEWHHNRLTKALYERALQEMGEA